MYALFYFTNKIRSPAIRAPCNKIIMDVSVVSIENAHYLFRISGNNYPSFDIFLAKLFVSFQNY